MWKRKEGKWVNERINELEEVGNVRMEKRRKSVRSQGNGGRISEVCVWKRNGGSVIGTKGWRNMSI
jgi:hypothetical protein